MLAWKRGLSSSRLVLVGIGIGFTATAGVDYLITRADIYDVQRAAVWLTGSLNGRSWDHVRTVGIALAVLAPLVNEGREVKAGSWLVEGIGEDFIPPITDMDIIDEAIEVSDRDAFLAARELLRVQGLLAGSSSGTLLARPSTHLRLGQVASEQGAPCVHESPTHAPCTSGSACAP